MQLWSGDYAALMCGKLSTGLGWLIDSQGHVLICRGLRRCDGVALLRDFGAIHAKDPEVALELLDLIDFGHEEQKMKG